MLQSGMEYHYALQLYKNEKTIDEIPIMFRVPALSLSQNSEEMLSYVREKKLSELQTFITLKVTESAVYQAVGLEVSYSGIKAYNTEMKQLIESSENIFFLDSIEFKL